MLLSKVNAAQLTFDRLLTSMRRHFLECNPMAQALRAQLAQVAALAAKAEQELKAHRDFVSFVESEMDEVDLQDDKSLAFAAYADGFTDAEIGLLNRFAESEASR